jgi:hypothetical protein
VKNLLIAMFAAGLLAAVIFQVGIDPRVAGLIAGTGFVTVGMLGIWISWKRRGGGVLPLFVLGLSLIHVTGIAIPMIAFRLLNWEDPFSKVAVWGLSGPDFHAFSTRFYGFWIVIVAFSWWVERKKDPLGSFSK